MREQRARHHTFEGPLLREVVADAAPDFDVRRRRDRSRFLLAVTGGDGHHTVLSWGEIDPDFGAVPALLATTLDGVALDLVGSQLVVPTDRCGARATSARSRASGSGRASPPGSAEHDRRPWLFLRRAPHLPWLIASNIAHARPATYLSAHAVLHNRSGGAPSRRQHRHRPAVGRRRRVATHRDDGGRRLIDGRDLAAFSIEVGQGGGNGEEEVPYSSARNAFPGIVTAVKLGDVAAQVEIQAARTGSSHS